MRLHPSSYCRKHELPSCPITFRSSLSTRLNHEPSSLLVATKEEKKKKESAITLSFGSIFFQLLLPFVFVSSSLFSSLPAYDLCAGCGPGTFSAALACGYFRSVAFQVVRSTLPVSDVVALFKGTRSSHHKPGQTHSARSHLLIVELLWGFFSICFTRSLLKIVGF